MSPTPVYLPATGLIRDEPVKQNFEFLEAYMGRLPASGVTVTGQRPVYITGALSPYTARPFDFVYGNNITVKLPVTPPNGTVIGVAPGGGRCTIDPTGSGGAIYRWGVSYSTPITTGIYGTIVLVYTTDPVGGNYWRVLSEDTSVKPWAILSSNATFNTNNNWAAVAFSGLSAGGGLAGPGVNSSGITVQEQGIYRASANIRVDSVPAGTYSQMQIERWSQTAFVGAVGISIATGNALYTEHVVSVLTPMNSQDYIIMKCFTSSTGTWQAITGWIQMACELVSYGPN